MDFRLELHIKKWQNQIHLTDPVFLMGSCFTEHMAQFLSIHRFQVLENPHGILFNPVSILNALKHYSEGKKFQAEELFYYNNLWHSWYHHGRFDHLNAEDCLLKINDEIAQAYTFLQNAKWMIVTLGSSFIYELNDQKFEPFSKDSQVVSNCHKVPASSFNHRILSYNEAVKASMEIVDIVRSVNPSIQVIFTISPVRHYREGLVENNRSKGLLHLAIQEVVSQKESVFYFPSYELMIDDLRDYRFYAEDMVHPNYQATRYIWEKFKEACIDEESRALMEKIYRIHSAMQHKPMQPESISHKQFLEKMLRETEALKILLPFLPLEDALEYFKNNQD